MVSGTDKYPICRESDFRRDFYGDLHHDDKPKTTLLSEQEKIRKENEDQHKKTFKLRPIVHPKFQNISADDAIKVAVCIFFKPSSSMLPCFYNLIFFYFLICS